MTNRIVNSLKSLLIFSIALFGIIACEKDFEDVGVNIVDNNLFNTKDTIIEVIAYTKNVERSEVIGDNAASGALDGLPIFNIGVLKDPNLGTLTASFVSQVQRPALGIDFGLNPVIDAVVLDIPYFATRLTNNEDNTPNFELDSIFGSLDTINLKVHRLKTFLNTLDPEDPTQNKRYFSDENYETLEELYASSFIPNKNDTVLYVPRNLFEGSAAIDTIKKDDLSPSIKLELDKELITNIFIDNITEGDLASPETFLNYFRGLIIEASERTPGRGGPLMQLALNNAAINIYYTFDLLTDETTADLNGDGDTDDLQVPVKTKGTLSLLLSGIRTAIYDRDYSQVPTLVEAFNNPNLTEGSERLYISGAAGTMVELDLFKSVDIDEIRNENWLINGAILELYIDQSIPHDDDLYVLPSRLYLYNADDDIIVKDVITEGQVTGIGGFLVRNENDGTPEKYQFLITDYISDILKSEDPDDLSKLAIKMYHITDAPVSIFDTIVRDFSWDPKGVIIKGNNALLSGTTTPDPERLKLKIYYTEDPQ